MCAVVRLSVFCTDNFTNKNDLVCSKFSSLFFLVFVCAVAPARRKQTRPLPDHRPGFSRALCLSYKSIGVTRAVPLRCHSLHRDVLYAVCSLCQVCGPQVSHIVRETKKTKNARQPWLAELKAIDFYIPSL